MKVLVTGASGMIGSHLVRGLIDEGYEVIGVDRKENKSDNNNLVYKSIDLSDKKSLHIIINDYKPDRIIHLAALAHSVDGKEYTWDKYKHFNVNCAKNVFTEARDIPVLFISTVDVYGFTTGAVGVESELKPVSYYAKSKKMAEVECKKIRKFDIFRFSPVYTDEIKRDVQKRYYLKYPSIAYRIGKGTEYEILNIKNAVQSMVDWCEEKPANTIRIIKDDERMWTPDYIRNEKMAGRAKFVVYVPQWMANIVYVILKRITGENKYTYLLNKAVHPLRTE